MKNKKLLILVLFVCFGLMVALFVSLNRKKTDPDSDVKQPTTAEKASESADTSSDVSADVSADVPSLTVTSDILGLCDTGNKTTLKQDLIYTSGPGDINIYHYDENGNRVIYENQEEQKIPMQPVSYTGSAIFSIGPDADDSKIDCSNAKVTLLDSSNVCANELILKAVSLNETWKNGQYIYTLNTGDLEWNTWEYDTTVDYNSGREWSIMGGDGAGTYFLRFEVSGITYDGNELPAVEFPVTVYCYGRTCTDLALSSPFIENTYDPNYTSGIQQTGEIQWNWYTDGEDSARDKPYMNDLFTDYFTVIWPEGTDASNITENDVVITLTSDFNDSYDLSVLTEYGEHEYAVIPGKDETTIAVLYQQWAGYPVFSHITIAVKNGSQTASQTFDVASVVANPTQTGGGGVTIDHTLTCLNYQGVEGMTLENAVNSQYTLSLEKDGTTFFYAEDNDGNGYLSEGSVSQNFWGGVDVVAPDDAWHGDGIEIYNIAVINNVVFVETRVGDDESEVKIVDGTEIIFTRNINATKSVAEMIEAGASLKAGYNLTGSGTTQWAWTMRYQSGWTTLHKKPETLLYTTYPYGYAHNSSNPIYEGLSDGSLVDGKSGGMGPGGMGPGGMGPGGMGPGGMGPDGKK